MAAGAAFGGGRRSEQSVRPVPPGPIVADASFILAVLEGQPGATALVAGRVLARTQLLTVTLVEVLTILARRGLTDASVVEGGLTRLGIEMVDLPPGAAAHVPDLVRIDAAGRSHARARGDRTSALSLGDRCVLAYALASGLPVLTGDRYWVTLTAHGLHADVFTYQDA